MPKTHEISLAWTRGETCYWVCSCGNRGWKYYTVGRAAFAKAEREHPEAFPSFPSFR